MKYHGIYEIWDAKTILKSTHTTQKCSENKSFIKRNPQDKSFDLPFTDTNQVGKAHKLRTRWLKNEFWRFCKCKIILTNIMVNQTIKYADVVAITFNIQVNTNENYKFITLLNSLYIIKRQLNVFHNNNVKLFTDIQMYGFHLKHLQVTIWM